MYKNAYRAFSTRYPKVQFAWSYKTNYLDAVCRVYHQEGAWAEVVSGFEYTKALNNGVDGKYIIFNGPDKSEEDLEVIKKWSSKPDELYSAITNEEASIHREMCENLSQLVQDLGGNTIVIPTSKHDF